MQIYTVYKSNAIIVTVKIDVSLYLTQLCQRIDTVVRSNFMKVLNSRRIQERVAQYFAREQLNALIGESLSAPVSLDEIVFDDPGHLHDFAEKFRGEMNKNHVEYTEDEALIASMILSVKEDIPSAILDAIVKNSHVFRKDELESNPYYKNIHFANNKLGKFELAIDNYEAYELFMYNTPKDCFNGVMIPAIGTTDYKCLFPNIKEDGSTWMSITPNEIYTMKKPIEDAAGKVLTLGCGMGYFAYMAALKDTVEHVTIIEKQPEVIELFNTFILPQFSCKDKITVIQADAFDYMKALADGEYDFCFVDIWKGNTDTVPYLKMKKLCSRFKDTTLSFWIEDALIATIMGYIYTIIIKELYDVKTDDLKLPEDERYKLHFFEELLSNAEITRPEHIDYYMDYHNIIKLMN